MHDWKKVKIRKDHKCNGCFATLSKGAEVMRGKGIHDGEFYNVYLCDPCEDHLNEYREDYRHGWADGDLGEGREEVLR